VKEEERDLGTSAWARHLNEASRITPRVKQYFKHFEHIFLGKRDHEVVSTERLVDRSFAYLRIETCGYGNRVLYFCHAFFLCCCFGLFRFKLSSVIVASIKTLRAVF